MKDDIAPNDATEQLLRREMALFPRFPAPVRGAILKFVPLFLRGKEFIGCNDLVVEDRHRILVAANAALVGAAQRVSCFASVRWILLYPDILHVDGEAFTASKVVLSWDWVHAESQDPSLGSNLVVHEFAHVLDHLLGVSHSTPAMIEAYEAELDLLAAGEESGFRDEDLENPQEFFAAASELFFTHPHWLGETWPALYRDLGDIYGLDMSRYLEPPPT